MVPIVYCAGFHLLFQPTPQRFALKVRPGNGAWLRLLDLFGLFDPRICIGKHFPSGESAHSLHICQYPILSVASTVPFYGNSNIVFPLSPDKYPISKYFLRRKNMKISASSVRRNVLFIENKGRRCCSGYSPTMIINLDCRELS